MHIGRYETLGVIGKGGMGTVHLARATGVGGFERRVALKVMHEQLLDDPQFVEMFLDEARLSARIHHPNVVATHDVHHLEHGLFLVMDYVEGPSLHAVLNSLRVRGRQMPLGVCLRIFDDALQGLHAAHQLRTPEGELLGLVHRDISPDNILIGIDGVTRLNDFGLARAAAQIGQTRGGHVKGKLAFLPPEALVLGRLDRRSDVYSLGVTLFEALTLKRLFEAESEGLLMGKVISGATTPPHEVTASIPVSVSEVCMRAISPDPERRFQSALDMGQALRDAAASAGISIATAQEAGDWAASLSREDGLLVLRPERPSSRPFAWGSAPESSAKRKPKRSRVAPLAWGATLLALGAAAVGTFVATRARERSGPHDTLHAARPSSASAVEARLPSATATSTAPVPLLPESASPQAPSSSPSASAAPTTSTPQATSSAEASAPPKQKARPQKSPPAQRPKRFDPDTL